MPEAELDAEVDRRRRRPPPRRARGPRRLEGPRAADGAPAARRGPRGGDGGHRGASRLGRRAGGDAGLPGATQPRPGPSGAPRERPPVPEGPRREPRRDRRPRPHGLPDAGARDGRRRVGGRRRRAPRARSRDELVVLGPAPARESYLVAAKILDAARATGADAVHPGFGFLSENAAFARAVLDAGLVWIGPPPAAIEAMGLKVPSRERMKAAGVPVVPGSHDLSPEHLASIGLPIVIKASAGGGGKGMRVVRSEGELAAAIESCRREAEAAFGDPTLYAERYLEHPRHIEIQVFGDVHGRVVALGERECSLQRRHQKVVEESPSPVVTPRASRADERGRRRGGEGGRLRQRRDGGVPPRHRRVVLLPRDEHAPPGGAPGHGGSLGARPRRSPARRRRGRAASARPAVGARARTRSRRASTRRIPRTASCPRSGRSSSTRSPGGPA